MVDREGRRDGHPKRVTVVAANSIGDQQSVLWDVCPTAHCEFSFAEQRSRGRHSVPFDGEWQAGGKVALIQKS
jgi:hypothetical protein